MRGMSLWTPDGEHEVPRDQPAPAPAAKETTGGIPGAPSLDDLSPEERAQAEAMAAELAEARERLADTPSSMVVANHAMGLYELGAIHLSNDPPNLSEAKVAIDAMAAIVDALPGRLGEHEETLHAARAQIQMAFVELSTQTDNT
ncbi:MAG: hypothetical protein ACI8XD_002043 [Thermoproteota archaeon]|jgi:hypothetical protein